MSNEKNVMNSSMEGENIGQAGTALLRKGSILVL
jgi:hypothetical protein